MSTGTAMSMTVHTPALESCVYSDGQWGRRRPDEGARAMEFLWTQPPKPLHKYSNTNTSGKKLEEPTCSPGAGLPTGPMLRLWGAMVQAGRGAGHSAE